MGKRKSRKPPPKAKRQKVPTIFDCPFCSHDQSIEVKLDRERQKGTLSCRICKVSYTTVLTNLSDPIDVYSEWIDSCAEVNQDEVVSSVSKRRRAPAEDRDSASEADEADDDDE